MGTDERPPSKRRPQDAEAGGGFSDTAGPAPPSLGEEGKTEPSNPLREVPGPAGTAKIGLSPACRGARPAIFEEEKEDWALQSLMMTEGWVETLRACSEGHTPVLCVLVSSTKRRRNMGWKKLYRKRGGRQGGQSFGELV